MLLTNIKHENFNSWNYSPSQFIDRKGNLQDLYSSIHNETV